jgi:hypothetical protein
VDIVFMVWDAGVVALVWALWRLRQVLGGTAEE